MKAENDGGVVSVKVGGKQDDRLVSALTAFPYLLREMTRRGQAAELNVGEGELRSKVPQAKQLTSFAAVLLSVEEAEERTDDTHR